MDDRACGDKPFVHDYPLVELKVVRTNSYFEPSCWAFVLFAYSARLFHIFLLLLDLYVYSVLSFVLQYLVLCSHGWMSESPVKSPQVLPGGYVVPSASSDRQKNLERESLAEITSVGYFP